MGNENQLEQVTIPRETLDFFNRDELRARAFYERYTLRDTQGLQLEKTPPEMWRRVSTAIASTETDETKRKEWGEKFYWLLEGFKFMPGGRILFGAGQKNYKATMLNCYVIPVKADTIEAIFDWCKEAARTYSYGGGVGTDISILRPRGARVNNAALTSSGAVSFMEIMSETTHSIGQAGRRGALMITILVDHPDVLEFIKVKRNIKNVRYANISVRVTDEFMHAVEQDKDFTLWYESPKLGRMEKKVRARELWKELVTSARDWAEPGLIFWDNVVRGSPSEYNGMNVITTNPCSEQPLEPYGVCNLGHLNLNTMVNSPFTENAAVDWGMLEMTVRYGVRFLDDTLLYNNDRHPLPEQAEGCARSRRVGLGVIGLSDMLSKMRIKYDSEEALKFVDELFERIKTTAYDESIELAKERGPFPGFDADKHLSRPFVQGLNDELRKKIKEYGLRNVAILTVPPTGGSVMAGTTNGIEPVFAFSYTRRSESLSQEFFKVYHPVVREYMEKFRVAEEKDLPEFFVPAHKIKPEFRVRMQGTVQKHIDSAISSTVNIDEKSTVEDVERIYMQAWKVGCKGITVYREGSREGILITEEKQKENEKSGAVAEDKEWTRPKSMTGDTLTYRLPQGSIYITINTDSTGPKEVFVNMGRTGSDDKSYSEAIGRLASLYFQKGGDVKDVIRSLKGIQGRTPTWDHGVQLLSMPDAVAKALEAVTTGAHQAVIDKNATLGPARKESEEKLIGLGDCPKCHEHMLVSESGCEDCKACGYSRCG
ncbi:MAG: adenosylcobalamin-dependent ribonucleoside-diphosphate reductase [Candidatus Micrarchaeota archaeon]|nr:adenosylcobalamin-dependent ribonucleoside-diphosphate reductase [Candidatus Micrarchaeota archaeon]MDE1847909.1 adenosylcobalamin-dependent ribonucleoside-diphosphate reductase [Candidatus Micrarchaeota archaeon]MDE1864535.1 adenosylcobalamin-dependent ribonucleoside-diphosphate reductase [Candidatus Micrarchaeota archaeon]